MRRMIFDFGSEKVRMGVQGSKRPPYTMPAVVAHRPPGEVVAVGEEALHMVGRTPADIETERPFGRGGVRSPRLAEALLRTMMTQRGVGARRPELWIALSAGASPIDQRGLKQLAQKAGAARVRFCPAAACRALGLDLPLFAPQGSLLIDVGASCTRVDLLSLGRPVASRRVDAAGDTLDLAVGRLLRDHYNLMVGDTTARTVKHRLLGDDEPEAVANGRDLVTGLPHAVTLQRAELLPALVLLADQITLAVQDLLRDVSPELVADLADQGCHLTGGSATLQALAGLLQDRLELPLLRDGQPEETICRGLQLALDHGQGERLGLTA